MPFAKLMFSFLFKLACVVGFTVQVLQISNLYFSYRTLTKMTMNFPDFIAPPSVSVCGRIGNIVNRDEVQRRFSIRWSNQPTEYHNAVVDTLSLKQLFDATPKETAMLTRCRVRFPGQFDTSMLSKEECQKVFRIDKYYMLEYICYMFSMFNTSKHYHYESVSQADTYRGRVYKFYLSEEFHAHLVDMLVVVHGPKAPSVSRYYSPPIRRVFDANNRSTDLGFLFTYSISAITKKPRPYDTRCGYINGSLTNAVCHKKCLIKNTTKELNKLPFNWIISPYEPDVRVNYDLKLLTTRDLANEQTDALFQSTYDECSKLCSKSRCFHTLYHTYEIDKETRGVHEDMQIKINLPMYPDINVTYLAAFELKDYLVYVMSCLGTWFGVSFIHLNPLSIVRRRSRRRNVECKLKLLRASNAQLHVKLDRLLAVTHALISRNNLLTNAIRDKR